jgi:hypothetical protein
VTLWPVRLKANVGERRARENSKQVAGFSIPGLGFSAQTSTAAFHTYEMDADNLKPIGHTGFTIDAQAMTALLFDFATRADYRAAVKKEFDGTKALFAEYQEALKKTYKAPVVPDPKD